jgi:hypothetical protein
MSKTNKYRPRTNSSERILPINGVACCDCGGAVELFGVPDAVWDGLGYRVEDYACMRCVARRLNPSNPVPDDVGNYLQLEISRQRKRFGLGGVRNVKSMGVILPEGYLVATCSSTEVTSVPKESTINRA